ncbi:hypothetical protein AJ78_08432 [Emergomyces pasteurianus Ep9510]|uniref:EthD domain-containing protein n=1 Tax=Emergomyces pasteurianus Ep9510 TaxID=1447872 RepID=A0A1J9Q3U5_9EURO|nr:hypothetical protein AJ78_08432 [Emergomyces pasteurianus Ep9510]
MSSAHFTAVIFVTRKPGISPAEFQDHWDNKHVPLLRRLTGPRFPLSHTRHYLKRDAAPPAYAITALVGDPTDITYDGFAVITFESEAAFQEFLPIMYHPEVIEDEKKFVDLTKSKAVALSNIQTTVSNN